MSMYPGGPPVAAIVADQQAAHHAREAESEAAERQQQESAAKILATHLEPREDGGKSVERVQSWSIELDSVPPDEQGLWQWHRIGLDLERAVTMTATISGVIDRLVRPGKGEWVHEVHEYHLTWEILDSLDGRSWHRVARGVLSPASPDACARISSPLGRHAQLALRPRLLGGILNVSNLAGGLSSSGAECQGAPDACATPHEHVALVKEFKFDLLVRCL